MSTLFNSPRFQLLASRTLDWLVISMVVGTGLLLITRYVGPIPVAVNQTVTARETTFSATGMSEIATVPDQAELSLGLSINRPTVAAAQQEANQTINTVTQKLQELGINKADIQTQNYSINPEFDYQTSSRRILGYQVYATLRVKVTDFSKLNQAIDVATTNGANQVGGIQFTLSKNREAELKQAARKEAITDAKKNAQELANLSGLRLGNVVDIQENTGVAQPPMAYDKAMLSSGMGGGAAEPTSIEPGSTTYTYSVTLSYQTL